MSKQRGQYTLAPYSGASLAVMLNHLITLRDIDEVEAAEPEHILAAQQRTADFLREMGVEDDPAGADIAATAAREAFAAVNQGAEATPRQREALLKLRSPAAVAHLTGMLTAYDWEFVEQAKEMRAYAVSQILEETKHPDARIRLKALQLLGNVTEVGLYTERIEVTKKDASEEELERRLRERLEKFLKPTLVEEVPATPVITGEAPGA